MKADAYAECLEFVAERDKLNCCDLHPVLTTDILTMERELGAQLPEAYEDFLHRVGAGREFGGLSQWYHFDLTRAGNLLEANQQLAESQAAAMREAEIRHARYPKAFLAIYDACDGEVFGFLRDGTHHFSPRIVAWDCEEFEMREVCDSFDEFLDYLSDCTQEDLENWPGRRRNKRHSEPVRVASDFDATAMFEG